MLPPIPPKITDLGPRSSRVSRSPAPPGSPLSNRRPKSAKVEAPGVTKLFNWGGAAHVDGDAGALVNRCAAGRVLGHHASVVRAVAVAGGRGRSGQPRVLQCGRRLILGLTDD